MKLSVSTPGALAMQSFGHLALRQGSRVRKTPWDGTSLLGRCQHYCTQSQSEKYYYGPIRNLLSFRPLFDSGIVHRINQKMLFSVIRLHLATSNQKTPFLIIHLCITESQKFLGQFIPGLIPRECLKGRLSQCCIYMKER